MSKHIGENCCFLATTKLRVMLRQTWHSSIFFFGCWSSSKSWSTRWKGWLQWTRNNESDKIEKVNGLALISAEKVYRNTSKECLILWWWFPEFGVLNEANMSSDCLLKFNDMDGQYMVKLLRLVLIFKKFILFHETNKANRFHIENVFWLKKKISTYRKNAEV